jgi:N6-L-threonylcarbamoyladenine synthase
LAASFQQAVVDVLREKTRRALEQARVGTLCVAGGVAANGPIRSALQNVASKANAQWVAPPFSLCTDNAAMIAWAAVEQMQFRSPDGFDLSAHPRMPLDRTATPMLGSGRKGAKA